MSGENNYEVHVALTGLNEAVSQLESFESRVASIGGKGGPVDATVVSQIATAKAELLNLRGTAATTLQGIREDLAKGIQPNTNLTGAVTESVKASLRVVNELAASLRQALDLKGTFNPSELNALTDGIRNSIINGGQSGLKTLRAEFQAFGKEMGLSTGLIGPVTSGRGANLAFDRAVNSVPPVDFTAERSVQQEGTDAAARLARAQRELAETLEHERTAHAQDLSGFDRGRGGGGGGGGSGSGTGGVLPPPGYFPDEGAPLPTPEEAAALVKMNLASRTSTSRGAGFVLPDYAGLGQSPFFDLIAEKTHKNGEVEPAYLKRVTDQVAIQQLQDDPTTEGGRRRQQEALGKSITALIQAQNEEAVALLENRGLLKKQSTQFSRSDDGTFIRRRGPLAGTPILDTDASYEQDIQAARQAAVTTARQEQVAHERAKKLDETSTLGGTFLGGFTSKGFENPGQGILPALVGTAGVLARYALDGAAIGAVGVALKGTLQEAEAYQKALVDLDHAAEAVHAGQIDLNGAFAEGTKYGIDQATAIELGTAGIRNYASEIAAGASATDIFTESVKQAGINAVITGQKAAESQKQLLAITNEFGTGSAGQARTNDTVFNAALRFNASPAEIQKSLVENGDLAQVAGFDQERLAASSAAIIGQGASPTGLTRLLARGGNQQFQGALSSLNVTNTGNVSDELDKASEAYNKLTNAQKAAFAEQSGGARSAAILIALLKEQKAINDSVSESYTQGGQAAQAALDLQNTAAGQLKQFFTELKNLGSEVAKSGVADILVLVFEVLKTGIGIVDQFAHALNAIGDKLGPFKDLVITAGELFLVLKAIRAVSEEKTILGGFTALGSKIRNKDGNGPASAVPAAADGAAAEIKSAGTTLSAAIEEAAAKIAAANGVEVTARETGAAKIAVADTDEAAARALGAGKVAAADEKGVVARLLGSVGLGSIFAKGAAPVGAFGTGALEAAPLAAGGIALGVGAAVVADGVFADKAYRNVQRQLKAREAARNADSSGTGDSETLAEEARKASSAAQAARASSGGFIGTLENFVGKAEGFGSTGQDAHRAEQTAAELGREAERQKKAEADFKDRLGLAGNFNLNAPDFTKGIQDLQDQGQNATEIAAEQQKFLSAFLARQNSSASFLADGQGGILAGKVANTTTSNLRSIAEGAVETGTDNFNGNGFLAHEANQKLANLNKDKQKELNDALNASTKDFITSNGLEGKDLAKLDKGTLSALATANKEALKKQLKHVGLSDDEIKAIDKSLTVEALAAVGQNAFHINDKSGVPLTPAQVTDAIKNSSAIAKGIGTAAGVQNVLSAGVNADQQGTDLRAQQAYLQNLRNQLTASNPAADVSLLDEQLNQLKVDIANATGTQAKAMAKYVADLLSPLDVSGRLAAQLRGVREALKTDKGQARRDDLDQQAQLLLQIGTRNRVTDPAASDALGRDTRDSLSAPKQALDLANRELKDAEIQKADQGVIDQKRQAVRQAQQTLTNAQITDANAQELGNVTLGDKLGELKAKYDGLIQQAGNQTGGQRAQTLREAQQTLVDEANASADIAAKQSLAALDPRDKIGTLQQQLRDLQAKTFAAGDTGGRADNLAQQRALQQQIADARRGLSDAIEESHVFSGDAVGEAKSKLDASSRALTAALKGTAEYYQAVRTHRDAEIAYAAAVSASSDLARQLSEDLTNPIVNARETLRKAQEKLTRDLKEKAPSSVLNQDRLDVKNANSGLAGTTFSTQLQAAATNYEIGRNAAFADEAGRLSFAQYIKYLENERTRLVAIKKRTFQQQDELNQVDQAIIAAQSSLQGQFNLSGIKIPTVYEVRRAVALGATSTNGGQVDNSVRNININVSGANPDEVKAMLKQQLGSAATTRVTVSSKKGI